MGGSGGSYDFSSIRSEMSSDEDKLDRAEFEAEVANLIGSVLVNANDRDVVTIQRHLDSIKTALDRDVEGFVDLLFGGSVSKRTYVAGLSDVDTLVVINNSSLADAKPTQVVDYVMSRLRERLPGTLVDADGFAITVHYSDGIVQLIPVRREGPDYHLPSQDCQDWSRVRPQAFTDRLTEVNRVQNGRVVPTVKLAKVVLAELPDSRRPTGYHLEALAVEAFSEYRGSTAPKEMLTHFLNQAAMRVLNPIVDPTGQSRHVDDALGLPRSLERQILSDTLGRICRRLQNADRSQDIDQWRLVFGLVG